MTGKLPSISTGNFIVINVVIEFNFMETYTTTPDQLRQMLASDAPKVFQRLKKKQSINIRAEEPKERTGAVLSSPLTHEGTSLGEKT